MNIGQIKQNDAGIFMGRISTLAVAMTIALKPVQSSNPRAPRYEIHALTPGRTWVQVGAFFELTSNNTGEAFLNGRIDDPSLAAPLQALAVLGGIHWEALKLWLKGVKLRVKPAPSSAPVTVARPAALRLEHRP